LEEEFGFSTAVRDNEGEAAEHGVYYDDSSYDYMQHMRELGGTTEDTWLEAPQSRQKQKSKGKQSLEDALRDVDLDDDAESLGDRSVVGSSVLSNIRKATYQDQQNVPDALTGFQPDMDPRLREVLEALDDEEYVDDEDEIFAELAGDGGEEIDQNEWEAGQFDSHEDGWESDDTTKPAREYNMDGHSKNPILLQDVDIPADPNAPLSDALISDSSTFNGDGDWLASFAKSKGETVKPTTTKSTHIPIYNRRDHSDLASSSFLTTSSQLPRRKKRKGALTSSTGFSMTSSVLARTEPLTLLDSRFDRIAESYMEDDVRDQADDDFDDGVSLATATTTKSNASRFSAFGGSQASEAAPQLMPANFDSVMDEFLGGTNVKGKMMKKGGTGGRWGAQTGMEQLDEIRQVLGPARFRKQSTAA